MSAARGPITQLFCALSPGEPGGGRIFVCRRTFCMKTLEIAPQLCYHNKKFPFWRGTMDTTHNRLLHGSVARALILFALPIIASNFVQNLYSMVDLIIVGRFSGTNSLSGVNIGGNVCTLVTNVCIGLCQGGAALIGQYLGSGNSERLRRAVGSLLTFLLLLALAVTGLLLAFARPLLTLMRTPAESFDEALRYVMICSAGTVFVFGYNALAAILRGIGDSRRPFLFVIIACLTNIVLDLLAVGVLHMGAAGAALATIFSQMLSMLICIVYMKKNGVLFDFRARSFRIDRTELRLLLQFGAPTCVQNLVTSLSFVVLTSITNTLGVVASAAAAAGGKLVAFGVLPCIAMTAAVSSMVAINEGAGERARSLRAMRVGLVTIYAINLAIFALVQLFARQLVGIFSSDPAVVAAGAEYAHVFVFDLLFTPIMSALGGLFIGTGHTMVTSVLNVSSSLVIRVPVAALFGLGLQWGLRGIGMGAPVSSLIVGAVCIGYYLSGRWKKKVLKDL